MDRGQDAVLVQPVTTVPVYQERKPTGCTIFHVFYYRLKWSSLVITQYNYAVGPCSSVGIATDYGLEGPRSNPGGDEIFRPSRPALGPTQLPVQWVPGLSRG